MIEYLLKTKKFIPKEFHQSFFDIDFNKLYLDGFRLILTDLDNTLISYEEHIATDQISQKFEELKSMGFEIIIISNNHKPRIEKFIQGLNVLGFADAHKPLKSGVKRAVKNSSREYYKTEIVIIGDQVMTDIWAANRYGSYSILVNPIKRKTEKWYTRLNRIIETRMLKEIKRKESKIYQELSLDKRC